jgi:D-alanyl-D-alanine carboxypeptidase
MKKRFILISFSLILAVGFLSWEYLIEKTFLFKNKNNEAVVKGVKFDLNEKEKANITFEKLIVRDPDAPIKIEDFGNFYARAKSAVIIDANTKTILHSQNAKERRAIASLTKVMTAVLVIEKIEDLEKEIVTIGEDAVSQEGTIIGCPNSGYCISTRLQIGEKISAWNLFQAMIMNSTNDSAVALASHIAGSEKEFVKMMNVKARELGLRDTNFCTASGLEDEKNPKGCYSTAYDLARITAYSLKYDEIWDTMKIQNQEIFSVDGKIKHTIGNTNKLIGRMPNYLGGKTGFTYEAGQCLMGAAENPEKEEIKVVGVVLDDYYRWEDMKSMLTWAFQAYRWPQ